MIVSRNIVSYIVLVLWSAAMPLALGMERDYPQLQLQENLKPLEHKRAHLSLASPVFYSKDPNPFSYSISFQNKPYRYLNDPLIRAKLSFAKTSLFIAIPVKHLFNLNDGSEVQFILESPRKNKQPVLISAFCAINALLPDPCFKKQLERLMASFYQSPLCTANSLEKLISAEVIKKDNISDAAHIDGNIETTTWENGVGTSQQYICVKNCMHGTKGCPDEKILISLLTKSKTKPYNNSLYQLHMNRQIGARKSTRPASAINLDLILDNCLKEMECAEIAAEKLLDDCFNELVVMAILTRSLIILPIIKECASSFTPYSLRSVWGPR